MEKPRASNNFSFINLLYINLLYSNLEPHLVNFSRFSRLIAISGLLPLMVA